MILIDASPVAGAHTVATWRLTITSYLAALTEGTGAIFLVCIISKKFRRGDIGEGHTLWDAFYGARGRSSVVIHLHHT